MGKRIVFFDDVCILCAWSVRFIFKNDPKGRIYFASFHSDEFRKIAANISEDNLSSKSVVYYDENKIYVRSDAVLHLAGQLRFPYPLLQAGYIFPRFVRDGIYNFIARKRYAWFGKRDHCYIPDSELKKQFLG